MYKSIEVRESIIGGKSPNSGDTVLKHIYKNGELIRTIYPHEYTSFEELESIIDEY